MTGMARLVATCLLLLGVAAAPAAADDAAMPPSRWISQLAADHPLVGRLWSTASGEFADPDVLREQMIAARFVLVGETHDNADHHVLQAWAIATLVAGDRRPAVVLEMLNADQGEALATYLAQERPDPRGLGAAVGWEQRGWPPWSLYLPIAEVALPAGLPLAPGDFSGRLKRTVLRDGLAGVPDAHRARLGLDAPLPEALRTRLLDDLFEAHCGLMSRESLAPLADLQRLRDATLAEGLVAADVGDGAVLIAGNGHVGHDRGAPWYLRERAIEGGVLVLALREVEDGRLTADEYVERDPEGAPVADYVWFTPRDNDRDHCAALADHLKAHPPGAPARE
jgi:uncharacterized iron-regulated protein